MSFEEDVRRKYRGSSSGAEISSTMSQSSLTCKPNFLPSPIVRCRNKTQSLTKPSCVECINCMQTQTCDTEDNASDAGSDGTGSLASIISGASSIGELSVGQSSRTVDDGRKKTCHEDLQDPESSSGNINSKQGLPASELGSSFANSVLRAALFVALMLLVSFILWYAAHWHNFTNASPEEKLKGLMFKVCRGISEISLNSVMKDKYLKVMQNVYHALWNHSRCLGKQALSISLEVFSYASESLIWTDETANHFYCVLSVGILAWFVFHTAYQPHTLPDRSQTRSDLLVLPTPTGTSSCLKVQYLFDATLIWGDKWAELLKKCILERKDIKVLHFWLCELRFDEGNLYIKCASKEDARNLQRFLEIWFWGQKIRIIYIDLQRYNKMFPRSASRH